MSGALISAIRLTPTHDGEAALVVELCFDNGGRSTIQLDAIGVAQVMAKAGVESAAELVGRSWTALDIRDAVFTGSQPANRSSE